MSETAYLRPAPAGKLLEHGYGDNVRILADAYALSLLARIGHPDCRPPLLHDLITSAYRLLLHAAIDELPVRKVEVDTRMGAKNPKGVYRGVVVDPEHDVVVVDMARAGILPAIAMQRVLLEVLDDACVRVDHVYIQRVSHPESGVVTGVDLSGSKIGGTVEGATVIVPDPMGATGSSVVRVIEHYDQQVPGDRAKVVCMHLMVTPEYLKRVTAAYPEVHIYALRVDRGLSSDDVLNTALGTRWDEERGLDEHSYIIPGAGGMGEVINNSWV